MQLKIERSVLKSIWRFAGGMMLISLVAGLNTQMDKLAISKLLPVESLGYYTLAISLSLGIIVLINPISIALLPRITALYSARKIAEVSKLFHKVSLIVSILVFSIMANMAFFAKELIWLWTGKMELAEHTYKLIPVTAFAYAMLSLQIIPFNIAIANGYTKFNNILGLISLFVTIPGYWIVTKNFELIGAAYMFCGVQTFTTLLYLYFINRKFIHTKKISTLYIQQMLLPLVFSLSVAFAFSFIPAFIIQNRLLVFLWVGVAICTTFSISAFIILPINKIKKLLSHSI